VSIHVESACIFTDSVKRTNFSFWAVSIKTTIASKEKEKI